MPEHPDLAARRAEESAQHAQSLEDERERASRHAESLSPAPRPGWGLWATERSPEAWEALSAEERQVWAQAERFIEERMFQAGLPGALRYSVPSGPVELYERKMEAIEAVLREWLPTGSLHDKWLRRFASELFAAADTGI